MVAFHPTVPNVFATSGESGTVLLWCALSRPLSVNEHSLRARWVMMQKVDKSGVLRLCHTSTLSLKVLGKTFPSNDSFPHERLAGTAPTAPHLRRCHLVISSPTALSFGY
eukprot:194654-Prorocentrum_minimum.AAC.2